MTKNKRSKSKTSTPSKGKSQGRPRKTSAKRPTNKTMHPLLYEIIGLVMIAIAIIMAFQLGPIGRILTSFSMYLVGNLYGIIPIILIIQAIIFMVKRKAITIGKRYLAGSIFVLISLLLLSHIYFFKGDSTIWATQPVISETWNYLFVDKAISLRAGELGGGLLGAVLLALFHGLFETIGATIAGIVILAIGLILLTGKALVPYLAKTVPLYIERIKSFIDEKRSVRKRKEPKEVVVNREPKREVVEEDSKINEAAPIISAFSENIKKPALEKDEQIKSVSVPTEENEAVEKVYTKGVTGEEENESYQLPSTDLLIDTPYSDQSAEYDSIQANAAKLESTFQSFGVKAKVTQVHLGPAVTKYEILPDTGVKVSRIVSLTDDIALALAASGIRIEAPIPGKSAIGIEVPNKHVAMVSLREVIDAKENNRPEDKLLISLGRDVTGEAMLAHLNKMPHMLIAGATGSGKSVCINGIIVSLLLRAKPHEVKMMMIDPKMVELNVYNGIPHLLAPVVTDPRKAAQALQKVVSEMERRYELFSHTGTRNLEGYNAHIDEWNEANDEKHPHMPYIVVIVDELADLMMVASNDVEDSITRLAQMARAAGIHLIIATQRPSVDVITGVIKANIPSRIAFAVSSAVDSRTIIDGNGAEKLLGRGDMLYLPPGSSKPVRVQGAFVSDQEVEDIVNFVIEQQKAQYQEEMIPQDVVEIPAHEETDELYDEAVQLVVEMQTASVSFLQRRFRIGYSRAARIIDQMEMRGVVGPPDGSRPRKVLKVKEEPESVE